MAGVASRGTYSYDEQTIENVIVALGLDVEEASYNDWLILCPYHNNTNDPSMTVSKEKGIFYCLNPSCNEAGTLIELVQHVEQVDFLRAQRFIDNNSSGGKENLEKAVEKLFKQNTMPTFSRDTIDRMHQDLLESDRAMTYMRGRGFNDETIKYFKFGYSSKQDMIATPMHDIRGNPVGVIGRTLEGKRFKNSQGLPVRQTLFNAHRATRASNVVIINESNFDAARVHQAGFPNVVASLGGNLSEMKIVQLARNFQDGIIIMTDDDKVQVYEDCARCRRSGKLLCVGHQPGLELGKKISKVLNHINIYWAYTGEGKKRLFAKDAGDMTDDQIRTVIENKISDAEASDLW